MLKFDVTNKVSVVVEGTKFQSNVQKFITKVTDITESVTKGWTLEYTPRLNSAGELNEPSQTFNAIEVPNFTEIQNQVFGAVIYFAQDAEVNAEIAQGKPRVRRVYEEEGRPFRITVSKQKNSFYVLLRVVDETSPFYMVALEFTVTPDRNNPNVPYIVGINQRLNPATGSYTTFDAFFVDSKRMFIEVYRNGEIFNLGNTVITGQTQQGFTVDRVNSAIQYIQKVDTVFKAQAFIVEQSIMEYAFAVAKEQAQSMATQAPQQGAGLGAFFSIGSGLPNQPVNQMYTGQPSFQTPQFAQGAPVMPQQFAGFQPGQQYVNPQQPAQQQFGIPQGVQQPVYQAPPMQQTAFQTQSAPVNISASDLPSGL